MFARYKIGDQVQTETPLFMHTGHEINLIIRFASHTSWNKFKKIITYHYIALYYVLISQHVS